MLFDVLNIMLACPKGQVDDCKSFYTGSSPVANSNYTEFGGFKSGEFATISEYRIMAYYKTLPMFGCWFDSNYSLFMPYCWNGRHATLRTWCFYKRVGSNPTQGTFL